MVAAAVVLIICAAAVVAWVIARRRRRSAVDESTTTGPAPNPKRSTLGGSTAPELSRQQSAPGSPLGQAATAAPKLDSEPPKYAGEPSAIASADGSTYGELPPELDRSVPLASPASTAYSEVGFGHGVLLTGVTQTVSRDNGAATAPRASIDSGAAVVISYPDQQPYSDVVAPMLAAGDGVGQQHLPHRPVVQNLYFELPSTESQADTRYVVAGPAEYASAWAGRMQLYSLLPNRSPAADGEASAR